MEGIIRKQNFCKKAWAFGACSLLFHLAFLFSQLPSLDLSKALEKREQPKKILVRLNPNSETKVKKQIVATQESSEKLAPAKKAYLGKKNNTFARQTKAAARGSFREAGLGSKQASKQIAQKIEDTLKRQKLDKIKFSDLAASTKAIKKAPHKKRKVSKTIAKGLRNGDKTKRGLASSSDFVEEVPLGDFTRLNTQEFQFYGFYHRIRQKLEQFWGASLQDQMGKIIKSGRSIASGQNLLTSLVIQMNKKGEIVRIELGSTSGIKELDQVAIDSFNKAGPFPNPPKEMVKNGKATIKWGFVVEAN